MGSGWRLAVAVFVLTSSAVAAQGTPAEAHAGALPGYRYRIVGVYDGDTGDPVPGVEVRDFVHGNSVKTSETGSASLAFLDDGANLVRLQKIGYQPVTMSIVIGPADTVPITVLLGHVVSLPTVVSRDSSPHYLSPALRGFEERRRRSATGYFISEAQLRKNDGRPLGNVLESYAPGVTIIHTGSMAYLTQSPRCSNGGPPDVFMDGVKMARPMPPPDRMRKTITPEEIERQPFDLTLFNVDQYAGVEWYPDETGIPIEFPHTSTACGALFLWTRER